MFVNSVCVGCVRVCMSDGWRQKSWMRVNVCLYVVGMTTAYELQEVHYPYGAYLCYSMGMYAEDDVMC